MANPEPRFDAFLSWLGRRRACPQGVAWLRRHNSLPAAADACPSAEWLLWTIGEAGFRDDGVGRAFAVAAVRRHKDLLPGREAQEALALLESAAAAPSAGLLLDRAAALAAQIRTALVASPQWTAASAAAATALWHAAVPGGWAAAQQSRKHVIRAAAWNPLWPLNAADEDRELARLLRTLLRPHDAHILSRIERRLAEPEPGAPPAEPCTGC